MATSFNSRLGTAPEEGMKAPCVASTTANITLSGEQTIDTVAVVAGNRVLVRNQTDASENGIYDAAAGAWTRSTDWNNADDVISGQLIPDANSLITYQSSFTGTFVIGTTEVNFSASAVVVPDYFGIAAGTVDVITVALNTTVTAWTNGLKIRVRASGANTSTTPTINPDGIGAKTITKLGNKALVVGDIPRASYEMILQYNSTTDKVELLNPNSVNQFDYFGIAGGTVDVITVTLNSIAAYTNGLEIRIRASGANTSTTPTININGLGAKTITKMGNQPLLAGDISRVNYEMILQYNSSTNKVELLNPADANTLRADLADDADLAKAAALVAFKQSKISVAIADAIASTVFQKLQEQLSVFDFMTPAEIADVVNKTALVDVTIAVNAAWAYASDNDRAIAMPGGIYHTTDTLWATPEGSTIQSAHVLGEGKGSENADTRRVTVIDASAFNDRPAVNWQLARDIYIGHLAIEGGGQEIQTDIAVADLVHDATWVTGGDRDSRYSPYCGIAIDAGLGVTPPDGGYSNMTYQGVVSGAGTLGFHIDNVAIRNFVVGIMHNPETTGVGQGDTWMVTNPTITNTKVPIATGSAQARAGTIVGGLLWYCRTAFSGNDYGQQQGAAPLFENTQFVAMFEMIAASGGFGTSQFIGCRAEEVHRIGKGGGAATTGMGISFTSTDIHLLDPTLHPQAGCPVLYDGPGAPFVMVGGYLGLGNYTGGASLGIIADNATFDSVNISLENRFQPYVGCAQDLNYPAVLRNCKIVDATGFVNYGESVRRFSMSGRVSEHWSPSRKIRGTAIYEYIPKNANNYTNIGTMSSIAFSATELSFDNTVPAVFMVDDLIMWQFDAVGDGTVQYLLPAAKVTGVVSNTVTCDLLFPRSYYDETYTGAGSATQIVQRMWAPGEALTGDTNSSTSLTNVSPTTILKDGDWLTAAAGIPANTRIVSGEGTATLVLSQAATDTAAGKTLYWDRLHIPTTTAAF